MVLLTEIISCGGGGGGSSAPTGPLLAWPRFRRNDNNTGLALSGIGGNEGLAKLAYEFAEETPSISTPSIGRDGSIYVGMEGGLLSLDLSDDAVEQVRWFADRCGAGGEPKPINFVSSPTISTDGRDIILGSADPAAPNGGYVFLLREPEEGDGDPECIFAFPTGSRSTALASVDGIDLQLLSFVIGTTSGRLSSISSSGQRRWSFPEGAPFAGDVSSSPAVSEGGFVFTSPDGSVHSVDRTGRRRWNTTIGGAYAGDGLTPSPAVFSDIFAVNAEGDIVALSSSGNRLWTFEPDAPITGSLAVSALNTAGGVFLGQNVVFALDQRGTLYGIGSITGELIRFCETENSACLPSSCPDEAECNEVMRCTDTTDITCKSNTDCPSGESCTSQFFCSDEPENPNYDLACTEDQCLSDEDGSSGLCTREAKQIMTDGNTDFRSSPALSNDSFIVATTTDGRVCARRLDGAVPNGTCAATDGSGSGDACTPDSCGSRGHCCNQDDDEDCTAAGRCSGDPSSACTLDTCQDDGETCKTDWSDGCIELGATVGTTTLSSPVIDIDGRVLVTTELGLARVE